MGRERLSHTRRPGQEAYRTRPELRAGQLEALAATVGTIDGELRQPVGLDGPADGPVLDYTPPAPADGDGQRARPARGRK
jgi:hypothetical protein